MPPLVHRAEVVLTTTAAPLRRCSCRTEGIEWVDCALDAGVVEVGPGARHRPCATSADAVAASLGSALLAELARSPGDHEVVKERYSAFFGTDLARLLAELGCDRIVLAGVNTHACVRASAIDAFRRDDHVILAVEGISSYDAECQRESMRYLEQSIARAMTMPRSRSTFLSLSPCGPITKPDPTVRLAAAWPLDRVVQQVRP